MNIRIRKFAAALWPLASAAGLVLSGASLQAQPSASKKDSDETLTLEKFVVAGSAIPTAGNESFSPVSVVTYTEMVRVGAAAPIEALRVMPDVTGNVATEQRTNGGTGAAGVNLRGLAGTLTLFDGRRTAGFDNFNVIPSIAIDRIEVVKDGAGAIYGSDALAGVFNTVMVSRFNGHRVDAYYGNTTKNDAGVQRYGLLAGHTHGKTNVVLGVEYLERNALHSSDREPSDQADQRFRGGVNGGSPTFSGRATARIGSATATVQDLVLAPGKTVGLTSADFVPFNTSVATSTQMLNFRQYTPSIPAQHRHSIYGRINQTLSDNVEVFARLIYTKDTFYNGLAPSPMPAPSTTASAARDLLIAERASPHIPTGFFIADDVRSAGNILNGVVPFRTIALGPRQQLYRRENYDFVVGANGKFGQGWTWSSSYVFSELYRDQTQSGAPGKTKLVAEIVAGNYNPWALDTAKGTGPTGKAFDNPAALGRAAASGNTRLRGTTRGFDANASGTLFAMPAGDAKIGFGADYYRNDSSSIPDAIFFTGDLLGLNGSNPTISRGYGTGAFMALMLPLVSPQMNIPFVRSLKLQGEGRYDYQTVEGYQNGASGADIGRSFTAQNPKVGLQWNPVEDLLIRGTWSTGFRLPSLGSLFAASGTSNPSLVDPLGFTIANQTPITTRGNSNLSPEKSKTYSFGVVYSPKAVSGLSFTADYYMGEITGLVGEGSQYILNVNAAGQGSGFVRGNPATINPNAPFANLITRSATGGVTTIASTNFNISGRKTTGVDWAVSYVWPWKEMGRFMTRVDWNTALSWDLTPVQGATPQSYLATYIDVSQNAISPGSIPRHKGQVTQTWSKGQWHVMVAANYLSKLRDNPAFTQGNVVRWIEPFSTVDANVEYKFKGGAGWRKYLTDVTWRIGGNNLSDESAPFAAGAFNDSYDVTTHSNRGRFLYTQVTRKF
ncbi:MAG: TonB-dependent receptor [Verrucomicrobia bacterium]|nr:TonB-dependent receptor [Verrucomicrobiota bacterium]